MSAPLSKGDIDIDVVNRDLLLQHLSFTSASINNKGEVSQHLTGIYPQQVPVHPITNICSLDYREAENLGYMKIDVINMGAYKGIRDEDHLIALMAKEVCWELFEHEEIVGKLYHIHDHFEIVSKMKPASIEQLAMVLALIRPGKRHLVGKPWAEIEKEIWTKTEKYTFKKSHAIGYAQAIVVQLQLILEGAEND